ncbi:Gfo/Idh/MocA family oxidoreductase [Schleiferiaceae bacterium]|nr:Gfo/Idh/MocA family oxidoreductase [Schleiferiaceae bacterium]
MRVLIYGFGRMGLTHYSILKGLNPEISFTVVEPSKTLRKLLKGNVDADFHSDDLKLKERFDITLITTPPFIHLKLIENCVYRGDSKVFVEKPFGGFENVNYDNANDSRNIYIGYVLRFNPCIQWVKSNVNPDNIKSIRGEYLSNTLVSKPTGWRNGSFSGVLNEVGSHVIDLIQYISRETVFDVLEADIQSVVSDIDDIVQAKLKAKNNISVSLYFNWVKTDVRKPLFGLELVMNNGDTYSIDQQQIIHLNSEGIFINRISVTDLQEIVPYYLRGIDFTKQMLDLLDNGDKMATLSDGLAVNKVMNKIIKHEDNTRG